MSGLKGTLKDTKNIIGLLLLASRQSMAVSDEPSDESSDQSSAGFNMATLLAIVLLVIFVCMGFGVISGALISGCRELCGSQRPHQPNHDNQPIGDPLIEDREEDTESDTESESSDGDETFNDERSSDLESQRTILPDENALAQKRLSTLFDVFEILRFLTSPYHLVRTLMSSLGEGADIAVSGADKAPVP